MDALPVTNPDLFVNKIYIATVRHIFTKDLKRELRLYKYDTHNYHVISKLGNRNVHIQARTNTHAYTRARTHAHTFSKYKYKLKIIIVSTKFSLITVS